MFKNWNWDAIGVGASLACAIHCALLPLFLKENVYKEVQIGKAKTLVFNAKLMFDVMMFSFQKRGVTMYNPQGNS